MINERAHMHERWAGRFLFEHFPGGEVRVWRNDKKLIQDRAGLCGQFLVDLAVQPTRRDSSNVVSCFVKRREGTQLKTLFRQRFQRNVDKIGDIFFRVSHADHRFECAGTGGWAIRLDLAQRE